MEFRLTRTKDLELVATLRKETLPLDAPLKDWELEQSLWWLARTDAGEVAGYAGLWPDDERGFLISSGVRDAFRGWNLQRRLIRARVKHGKRVGYRSLYTYVVYSNLPSSRSLLREGFLPTCVRGEFVDLEKVLS